LGPDLVDVRAEAAAGPFEVAAVELSLRATELCQQAALGPRRKSGLGDGGDEVGDRRRGRRRGGQCVDRHPFGAEGVGVKLWLMLETSTSARPIALAVKLAQ
jgi:hypothetical protein